MKEKIASIFYLKMFFFGAFIIVIGAIIFRLGAEIAQSSFTNNSFSLLLVSRDSKLIFVDKQAKSVRFISIGDIRRYAKGKSTLGVSIALGIPINGMMISDFNIKNLNDFMGSDNEMKLISDNSITRKNVNRYDIFKIMNAIRGFPKDNRKEIKLNIFDQKDVKDMLEGAFLDSAINNLEYTVEIENATSIDGLGSIFALILTSEGYNVIAVRTSEEKGNSYIAYPTSSDVYINSLINLTKFDHNKVKKSPTSDVTIFLGEELDAMLSP